MSETKAVHVVIRGRVQGVFYRGWTEERARKLGVDGWIRNRSDGAVEGLFSGPSDAVDALLDACRQGPPAARVDDIAVEPAEPMARGGFEVRQ